jgi:hypothetical protein
MKLLFRIERLEARMPRPKRRIILVWIDGEGRRTVAADTHPHLADSSPYGDDMTSIWTTECDAAPTH